MPCVQNVISKCALVAVSLALFSTSLLAQQSQDASNARIKRLEEPDNSRKLFPGALFADASSLFPSKPIGNSGLRDALPRERDTDDSKPKVLPDRPVSQFQRLVLESTGRLLLPFGAGALQKEVDLGASSNLPVSADYEIAAGDEILIRVWGGY